MATVATCGKNAKLNYSVAHENLKQKRRLPLISEPPIPRKKMNYEEISADFGLMREMDLNMSMYDEIEGALSVRIPGRINALVLSAHADLEDSDIAGLTEIEARVLLDNKLVGSEIIQVADLKRKGDVREVNIHLTCSFEIVEEGECIGLLVLGDKGIRLASVCIRRADIAPQ